MTRPAKPSRCTKAAKRASKTIGTCSKQQRLSSANLSEAIDALEAETQRRRLARYEETKKRNAGAQGLPRTKRRKKTKTKSGSSFEKRCDSDRKGMSLELTVAG
jgi:hypothetical protein